MAEVSTESVLVKQFQEKHTALVIVRLRQYLPPGKPSFKICHGVDFGINEIAVTGPELDIVCMHLLEVCIAWLAVVRYLPFRIQNDAFASALRTDLGDDIRSDGFQDAFGCPEPSGDLWFKCDMPRSILLFRPLELGIDVSFKQDIHIEQDGQHILSAIPYIGHVI